MVKCHGKDQYLYIYINNEVRHVQNYNIIIIIISVEKKINKTNLQNCSTCIISVLGSASINVFMWSLISLDIYMYVYVYILIVNYTVIFLLTCSPTLDITLLMRNFTSSWAVLIKLLRVCRAFTACWSPSTWPSLLIIASNRRVSGILYNSSLTYSRSLRLIQSCV